MNNAPEKITLYPTDYYDMDGGCTEVWQQEYPDDDPLEDGVDYVRADLEMEWRDIESAPKDGTKFVALSNKGVVFVGFWQGVMTETAVSDANQPRWRSCTHWMPLPPAPTN